MNSKTPIENCHIAVVGLGYVGLPLAVAFSELSKTIGFDIDKGRIEELRAGNDRTNEISSDRLAAARLSLTSELSEIGNCNVYIVTVPTPIDAQNQPDLSLLLSASESVGSLLSKGDTVIYESTVYPGATEEVCVPVLEQSSGLLLNQGFFVGYSPERINPGDASHSLKSVVKLTSGSTLETAEFVDQLYGLIVDAGTFRLSSIKEAEAAKVIENVQRDVNIALMNEIAQIFSKLDINTQNVLEAARTKWNFLSFSPGLVGGHCIGVDPYYLDHKAREAGYKPSIIPASRRINEGMGPYIAERVLKGVANVSQPKILVAGLSFKENCPDLRNTKVIDIYTTLLANNSLVDVYDPWVDKQEAQDHFGIQLIDEPDKNSYDAIILAVRHQCFIDPGIEKIRVWGKSDCFIFDVKHLFDTSQSNERL